MASMSTAAFVRNWGSFPCSAPPGRTHRHVVQYMMKPLHCTPIHQELDLKIEGSSIMCEACNGKGWLLCDFCKGQKTNVKSDSRRIYRRCPTCRAVGYVLCSRCKVYKCVTFPSFDDGEESGL